MSYKKMEAKLVEKVRELRREEDALLQLYSKISLNPSQETGSAILAGLDRIGRQMSSIEQLMAEMDQAVSAASPKTSISFLQPAFQV
jgi:hypothetical protein